MDDKYSGNVVKSRAIYPSRFLPYLILLVASKFFRSFGIYLSYDILKVIHVVQFLFFVKAGTSIFLLVLQKPFSSGKRLSKHQWFRISRHAFFGCVINLLWLFGLTLCGPLRALLLYEHSDMVIIAGASALFTSTTSPSRMRGAVFFLLAVIGILLFDHDDMTEHMKDHPHIHVHSSILTHLFDHLTNLTGLSDHKGGVVLLFCTLCLHVGYNSASKKLSVDVGGAKRLHALSTLVSSVLLSPWAMVIFSTREVEITSWLALLFPMLLVILLVFVADYYIEAACANKIEHILTNKFSAISTFTWGIFLSVLWNHPFVASITSMNMLTEDHMLSGGVLFSFVLFIFATHILAEPIKGSKGSMVGYSASGLPLYNFAGDVLHQTSSSIMHVLKSGLRQILEESDSRKIFYFLCVNLGFTVVELVYGAWTNSLGLISDGFHMLFDCSALVMGLYASVMSRWKATRTFPYGFDRVEVLSGFINALFLIVISFFVFTAALTRLFDPPEVKTERLLFVSVCGFLVNLVGIFAFHHGHSHGGGGHGHSHGGGHGHSHGGGGHGHSHGGGHSHNSTVPARNRHSSGETHHTPTTHNTNMEGVFLHILADTLGSVGVIISTLFIQHLGWNIADPVCSLFIAVLIFASVLPLVRETALILLLSTPPDIQGELDTALQKVMSVEGVMGYRDDHFWQHSSKVTCGNMHLQVKKDASEQKIISQVTSILKEIGINNLTVQVEKETYFQHMSGLGIMNDVYEMTNSFKTFDTAAHFINSV